MFRVGYLTQVTIRYMLLRRTNEPSPSRVSVNWNASARGLRHLAASRRLGKLRRQSAPPSAAFSRSRVLEPQQPRRAGLDGRAAASAGLAPGSWLALVANPDHRRVGHQRVADMRPGGPGSGGSGRSRARRSREAIGSRPRRRTPRSPVMGHRLAAAACAPPSSRVGVDAAEWRIDGAAGRSGTPQANAM